MPASNILHNSTDPTMLARLKEMLGSSDRADIAVGYFFVSGFETVADEFSRLKKARVLVGRTDRETLEAVALGLQQQMALQSRLESDRLVPRRQREAIAKEAVDRVAAGVAALPQTDGSQEAMARLRELIVAGFLEIRAYQRELLHAKAYLCWYDNHAEPGAAVVGSSNMTLAGFEGNTELNVRVTGDAEMAELGRWFDDLWNDSEDISAALEVELSRSWALAQTPPYHVYLKALYELYHDDALATWELPLPVGRVDLANFQLDAVRWGLSMIDRHGGCYIGDVVGLGKTYIGAELLRQLRQSYPRDGEPLIICPAGLVPIWERVNELFQLGAEVVSQSRIAPPPDAVFDEDSAQYIEDEFEGLGVVLAQEYRYRGPVLVDEAHNFRNANRRSAGLRHYLESGDHKVILLSATPQNLGPRDVYRQLRLFLDETDHGLNIEPLALSDYFNAVERWHRYRLAHEQYLAEVESWRTNGRKGTPPIAPERPRGRRADIEQVLGPVFIRRRRKDLGELYGESAMVNGQPVRFPEPVLGNLEYRLDQVYAKAGPFDQLEKLLGSHKAYRYRAVEYLKSETADKPQYQDLHRARNRIAGLMASLLLKRLESSIEAFRSTLLTLINSNRNFRAALDDGYAPIGATATRLLSGGSFDSSELLQVLQQEERRRRGEVLVHPTSDFKVDQWFDDLDADHRVLCEIRDRIADIGPEDDDKLATLKAFLARPDVQKGKVLVFSEAETTIDYLHEQLNPGNADVTMAKLSGSNRDNAVNIVRRFSPTWNSGANGRRPESEIRVLLATDVVSEGQNLQDCARVLNYDLHWNPVRLIQRFGRVDRIGTEHETIHLHNMWPDLAVDSGLTLTERLNNRIQLFHDLIGLDSRLLSDVERLNVQDMYRIYEGKELPETDDGLDEIAVNQRGLALLQRIQEEDPNLWSTLTDLPDGIRSALAAPARPAPPAAEVEGQGPLMDTTPLPFDSPGPDETVVLLSDDDVKSCYAVGSDLQPRPITPAQFIAAVECQPDTPAMPLPEDTNERVMAAFDAFHRDLSQRLGRSRRRSDTRNRRYLSRRLGIARNGAVEDLAKLQQVNTLREIFLNDVPPQVDAALTDMRNMGLDGPPMITRLQALRERFRLNPPDTSDDSQPVARIIRIVCSDGLV